MNLTRAQGRVLFGDQMERTSVRRFPTFRKWRGMTPRSMALFPPVAEERAAAPQCPAPTHASLDLPSPCGKLARAYPLTACAMFLTFRWRLPLTTMVTFTALPEAAPVELQPRCLQIPSSVVLQLQRRCSPALLRC